MHLLAELASLDEVAPWRDLYRHEMNCQIVFDSIHARHGWTEEYLLSIEDVTVGYGSVAIAGPWEGKPTLYEFYVVPQARSHVFKLFDLLQEAGSAVAIETQSNAVLLTVMLHTFAQDIRAESILFHDGLTTSHHSPGATFRPLRPDDGPKLAPGLAPSEGDWVLEVAGKVVASGGIATHYNRPYGDLYMGVAEEFRRQGLGTYLVQELKSVCYAQGTIPTARCNPNNVASRKTLQNAGFVPYGHILTGTLSAGTDPGSPELDAMDP